MSKYNVKKIGARYTVFDGDSVLTTPGGNPVTTGYQPLAERMIRDLNRYGYSFHSASSILAWHFTMIDNFAPMGHASVVQMLSQSFLSIPDWTCVQSGAAWKRRFGSWSDRAEQIAQWFERATVMQLTAACCIGNAYESVNLAFELAKTMERFPAGEARDQQFSDIAALLAETMEFGPKSVILEDFKTFELYYGFHLEEDGPILTGPAEACEEEAEGEEGDEEDDELDVDDLTAYRVGVEQLIGRNFAHYTDGKKDAATPDLAALDDLDYYMEKEDEDEDAYDDEPGELETFLPQDCWVKRFVDDEDPHTCYLLFLVLDDDGKIGERGCLEETTKPMGFGGLFFMMPGEDLSSSKHYAECYDPPESVIRDLRLLFSGRSLPRDFTFVGKRLPQAVIDAGGNGGSDTEYTYALQSAYRLAYMHMSVLTDEDGVIEGLSYSTYQSSGDSYGDMFSRPVTLSDRLDEALDMLLYLYDLYTEEELQNV